jgi:hypothetical protein
MTRRGKGEQESEPPVVFRVSLRDVQSRNLEKELKIHLDDIDRDMERAARLYMWWSGLYSTVSGRVAKLQEQMEELEADLFVQYSDMLREGKKGTRVTDIKYYVIRNSKYRRLSRKLRKWQDSERMLKFAEKAFTQRKEMLQSLNANQRREKELT